MNNPFSGPKHTDLPTDNSTISITQLPANILEAFIPGYSIISKFLLDVLGFDVTLGVSVCFLIFGLATCLKFAWKHTYRQFEEYFMSYIRIDSDDDIHDHIMEWLAAHKVSKTSRKLMVKTGRENAWDMIDGDRSDAQPDSHTLVNYSNWDAKVPPRFQPSFGSHMFWHKGMLFQFKREEKHVMSSGWGGSMIRDDENVTLTCIGRSTQPIKDLIKDARDHYLDKEKSCTIVRRPCPKEHRGRGRNVWMKVATRPSRPIDTVVLAQDQKHRVLMDINEYLHPATPKWYANRGIPYRRGYLFHGPPGTGKSSLGWALAGVFGLDIYCISLVDPTLTEEDLGMMFTSLPRRCVVLLEDIDAAGLNKRQEADQVEKPKDDDAASKIGAEITKAFQSVRKGDKDKQGITLSGLLNAIDGVASHEGRVLVMTTNFPDKLDEALIRPGRIDMKVAFTNATKSQISELFVRMYSPDGPDIAATKQIKLEPAPPAKGKENLPNGTVKKRTRNGNAHSNGSALPDGTAHLNGHVDHGKTSSLSNVLTPPPTPKEFHTPTNSQRVVSSKPSTIEEIAKEFAERLPADTFTPAEVQGFLLTRKKEPERALEEVETWRDGVLEAREKKASGKVEGEI